MGIFKNDWADVLEEEFEKDYYIKLRQFLIAEYKTKRIHPDKHDIFNALHDTPLAKVKVVIIGQDPYHGPGQAHGMSFSVLPGVPFPPSLLNIFKEMRTDLEYDLPKSGYLKKWADEGVLLLNTVLTVREGEAHSHKGQGWEIFTDRVIQVVNDKTEPVVFILWGKPAQEKIKLITNAIHYVITAPHPSPLSASRGFFGSKPFSKANTFLEKEGRGAVDWRL